MVGTGVAERNLCTCARIEWLRMPEIIQITKEEKGLKHMKTKDLVLCAMFVALIAVGAFIKIPVPVVPFTLQFLFTMLAGLLLGPVNGALAVVVYIVLGLIGLPISGTCGTSDLHPGRRTGIYFPAEFWIYHRICGCGVCEW